MSETATLTPGLDAPPVDAGKLYEVVNGQVVEPPPMGAFEVRVTSALFLALAHYVAQHELGWVDGEMLFLIDPEKRLQRRPDLAFVSHGRWPQDRPVPNTAAWDVVPDLAVEVISPGNRSVDDLEKIDQYFRAGVRLVWVFYPSLRRVYVYQSPNRITVLDADDTLDGGDVVPGFRLRVAGLFQARPTGPAA